jgi:hypothetical protein
MTARPPARRAPASGTPAWWASWVVRSAARPLPAAHRDRYRQEFPAELHGMTPAQQLQHATGVLSRTWSLRTILNEPARLMAKEAAMCPRGTVDALRSVEPMLADAMGVADRLHCAEAPG